MSPYLSVIVLYIMNRVCSRDSAQLQAILQTKRSISTSIAIIHSGHDNSI